MCTDHTVRLSVNNAQKMRLTSLALAQTPFSGLPAKTPANHIPSTTKPRHKERVTAACSSSSFTLPDGRVAEAYPLQTIGPVFFSNDKYSNLSIFIELHKIVRSHGTHNFCGARKSLPHTTFNISVWRKNCKVQFMLKWLTI